jgi:hypothetical protein
MDLIFQYNKRFENWSIDEGKRKRVTLCLSRGAYNKFSSDIPDWLQLLKDVIIIENLPNKIWSPLRKPFEELLTIKAIETPHNDLGDVSAIGLKITIKCNSKDICIGFTGDTPYDNKLANELRGSDILCVHLGTVKYPEIGYNKDIYNHKGDTRIIPDDQKLAKLKETYYDSNHLLLFGTQQFIRDCFFRTKKEGKIVVVGEFGEELKYGLRTDLCQKLTETEKITCIPGDIGLHFRIKTDKKELIRCNFCEEMVDPTDIKLFSFGCEDAIHYICKSCKNTLSDVQKQAIVEFNNSKR